MSIFAIADATWGAAAVADHQAGKPPFNNAFASVVGNGTVFTIGGGTTANTYSSNLNAITDLQEMLRLLANFSPENKYGNFLVNQLAYNSGGGQTLFLFGPNKALGYRLSRNFTSDRYCRTTGLFREGVSTTKSLKDHVEDVTWQPKEESAQKRHMVLAILFSLSLLIWDLCIVYKLKTSDCVEGVDTSIGSDQSPNAKPSNANIIALLMYEHTYIQLLEIVERALCSAKTAKNGATELESTVDELKTKLVGATGLEAKVATIEANYALKTELADVKKTAQDAKDSADAAKKVADNAASDIQAALPRLGK